MGVPTAPGGMRSRLRSDKSRDGMDHQPARDEGAVGQQRKSDDCRPPVLPPSSEMKRGMIGQLIDKVRTKEDRGKKSPGTQEEPPPLRPKKTQDRDKSISRVLRGKTSSYTSVSGKDSSGKISTLYHSLSGKVLGNQQDQERSAESATRRLLSESHPDMSMLPSEVSVGCVDVERLESQLKEKLHDMGRSVGRIIRPKDPSSSGTGSLEDGDYQRISSTEVRALVHRDASSTPAASPRHSTPLGWGRESIKKQSSCESLSLSSVSVNSRRSSTVELAEPPRSASAGGKIHRGGSRSESAERRMQKQHSWETFPPKRGAGTVALAMAAAAAALAAERAERVERAERAASAASNDSHRYLQDPNDFQGGFDLKPSTLKKADSFEGHEEAVRTLVAAVQETRTLQRKPKPGTSS